MKLEFSKDKDYNSWIHQIKAVLSVNREMLAFYWDLGKEIIEKQETQKWGDAVVEQLGKDLQSEFSEMKGFSRRNLFYMKKMVFILQ